MPRKTNPRQGRAIKDAKRGNCRFPSRGIETIELGPMVLTVTCTEPLPLASRVSAVGETAHVGPVGDTVQVIEVNVRPGRPPVKFIVKTPGCPGATVIVVPPDDGG
jgi:hypothetical protein